MRYSYLIFLLFICSITYGQNKVDFKEQVEAHYKKFDGSMDQFFKIKSWLIEEKKKMKSGSKIDLQERIQLYSVVEFSSYIDNNLKKSDCEKTRMKIIHNFSPKNPRPSKIPWGPAQALGYLSKICEKL